MAIERRKKPETPAPSPDTVATPLDRQRMQEKLLGKIDAKIAGGAVSQQNRVAVGAYLLATLQEGGRPLADEAGIMRLLFCGAQQMKAGQQHVREAVGMQNTLGRVVTAIEREMAHPDAAPQQPQTGKQISVEKRLKKFAEKVFVSDPNPASSAGKSQRKEMRMAVALIARTSLGKNSGEAAKLLGPRTLIEVSRQLLIDAREEYAAQDRFYEKVRAICEEIGVATPLLPTESEES